MTLLAALLLTVILPMLCIVIGYFIKETVSDSPLVAKFLNNTELEEARKYATLFGLHNDHDVDVKELLAMGRKYAAFIGNDRMDEMVELIQSTQVCYVRRVKTKGAYHRLNHMIQAHALIAGPSFIVLTTKIFGGDRDGEPSTVSFHRAA